MPTSTNNQNKPQSSSHVSIARTLAATIDSYGIDSAPIFKRHHIEQDQLADLEKRILDRDLLAVWQDAERATMDDAFGIRFAEQFKPGSIHGLGFSWAASDNLLDGFARLSRFFRVISSAGHVTLTETTDSVEVELELIVPSNLVPSPLIDASLALFLKYCRFAGSERFAPTKVNLQRAIPDNVEAFRRFFTCPIEFNASKNSLIFKRENLLTPLPISNPKVAKANDSVVQSYLDRFDQDNFAALVKIHIVEALPQGHISQKHIAKKMYISVRTLQRKLRQEDTSFSELVDSARLALAQMYLQQPWRSVNEISYLLGYNEPRNFSRAFKRQTGEAPREYRARLT